MYRSALKPIVIVFAWLFLTATTSAGPLLSTGPFTVNLPGGGSYEVSSEVSQTSAGYLYTYSVKNLTQVERSFELGIAESPDLYGLYSETNPQVSPGAGELLRDQPSLISYGPGTHNYAFTQLSNHVRIGIAIQPGQTQVMSFEDMHIPTLADWELRERSPGGGQRTNTKLGLGQLGAPSGVLGGGSSIQSAPEPATLTLALLGVSGLGITALRRRRNRIDS